VEEGNTYHGDPQVNSFVVEEPIRERSLGTHHIGVLLRSHALLVLLRHGRAVDFILEVPIRFASAVGRRAELVGLRYHGRGFWLALGLGFFAA
jgi:hypothetical protein